MGEAERFSAKAGRYLFFAVCAFGVSIVVGAPLLRVGCPDWIVHNAAAITGLASFLALRDMLKERSTAEHEEKRR